MWIRLTALALIATTQATMAQEVTPLATPGWLSDSVTRPHANVATSVTRPAITVMPLGAIQLDAVGLLSRSMTGLPPGLWGGSDATTLANLMRAQSYDGLPAVLAFTETLALAELDPPAGAPAEGSDLFLARIDLLLARGALDQAQALIERAGPTQDSIFRRWFDVSLLTDQATRACAAMRADPDIAPTFPARIFCLARSGDWSAAALSLDTGAALGYLSADEADLIARFLDPELFEGEPPLPPDRNLTPLTYQMRAALGERPSAAGLPLAFAHADLADVAGWRAQLDAAERLTRSGAITPSQWLEIYTARVPSASGGVWDRVAALQAFDAAILAGEPSEIARLLPAAWAAMDQAGLEVAFALIYAERLARQPFTDEAAALTRQIGLLSPFYEIMAQAAVPQSADERLTFAIARGLPPDLPNGADLITRAVVAAFSDPDIPTRYQWLIDQGNLGEALLRAALVLNTPRPDADDLTDALRLYRSLGLEDVARRAALQLLLLRS
jgi:hypothetical protein